MHENGRNALHLASEKALSELVEYLIKKGTLFPR